jgi:hypothetical protein
LAALLAQVLLTAVSVEDWSKPLTKKRLNSLVGLVSFSQSETGKLTLLAYNAGGMYMSYSDL